MSIIHRIIPEKVDIAVGGGGSTTRAGSWAGADVIVVEGATAFAKRAKQQKCDTSASNYPGTRGIPCRDILPGYRM